MGNKAATNTGNLLRRVLMIGGVAVVLAACAYFYAGSGRFIETDNAYVKAAKILVTPQVAGTVMSVAVKDNQAVKAGDVLFTVDADVYRIAVDKARADLANVVTDIEKLKAQYRQKVQELAKAGVEVDYTSEEYSRRVPLVQSGATAKSEFNDAKRQRDSANKAVASLQEEAKGIRAALAGDPNITPEKHPLYQRTLASLHQAELELDRTKVKAPADGIIGTAPHAGDYARLGVPMLELVGTDSQWIEANFKETELTDVKVGQKVDIEVDTYPGHSWQGRVESISPATGSEFSVLPAQNATGNWVKIVQRIGVRIALEPQSGNPPLRTGMSTVVSIDTGRYPHALIQSASAGEQ